MAVGDHDRGWENEFVSGQSGLTSRTWQFIQNKICPKGAREGDFCVSARLVPLLQECQGGIPRVRRTEHSRKSCQGPDRSNNLIPLHHNVPSCPQLEADVFIPRFQKSGLRLTQARIKEPNKLSRCWLEKKNVSKPCRDRHWVFCSPDGTLIGWDQRGPLE